jgi:molybdopterin molybdotransferase
MIEFAEACELIFKNISKLGTEDRNIEDSIGYALANDIVSSINVAPFRNSAMDGFAVKTEWLTGCSKDNPVTLPIGSTSYAGKGALINDSEVCVPKVMTGARVPAKFDAVVPFEETKYDEKNVSFLNATSSGKHVREAGEDIVRGQKLFTKGTTLGRLDIGVLANVGLRSVRIYRKPSVSLIATGDELVLPGEELTGDKIYDSNTFTLLSLIMPFCGHADRACCISDNKDELLKVLDSDHDVIVTSGGVSAGERDLVIDIAESLGWQRVFHKVRMKPGKPVYFATRGKQVMFGLPGNPLSATVTAAVFLIPALKKMSGLANYQLCPKPATLAPGEGRHPKRKLIWPGFIKEEAGHKVARFSQKKSSAALTALMGTDGLIIQETANGKSPDITVETILWEDILN